MISLGKWVVIGLTAAVVLWLLLASFKDDSDSPNVLAITIDALRADHLGCYGYSKLTSPNISRLAQMGVRFENVSVPRALTWPSLGSLWTSLYPATHGVREGPQTLNPELPTLPSLFRESGYRTAAFVANYFTETYGFERFENSFRQGETQGEWDRKATEQALNWLESRSTQPFFCWIHYMGPHSPYDPGEEYARRFTSGEAQKYSGTVEDLKAIAVNREQLTREQLEYLIGRYDAQIAETDAEVGRLLAWLEQQGRLENTLVVLSADHGEELYDHHYYFAHAGSIYEGSLRVPLIVAQPGRFEAGQTRQEVVEILDLFPTLLEAAGLQNQETRRRIESSPAKPEGASLLPLLKTPSAAKDNHLENKRYAVSELVVNGQPILAIRDIDWKLIMNPQGAVVHPYKEAAYTLEPRELYHLSRDPREQRNVLEEHREVARRLEEALSGWMENRVAEPVGGIKPEAIDVLKGLGYFQ